MTELEKAYLAGLFDGEAHFALEKTSLLGRRPAISINMTCKRTIEHVQFVTGYGAVHLKSTNPAHKLQWRWTARSNRARALAADLLPYLVTRKEAAQAIIDHVPLPKGGSRRKQEGEP